METEYHIDLSFTIEALDEADAKERALEWVDSLKVPDHIEVGGIDKPQEPVDVEILDHELDLV